MTNRTELKEQDLENVIGGAFHYNTYDDGTMTCRVDDVDTFYCTANAESMISTYIVTHKGCTLDDVINYALLNKYFWK